MVRAMPGDEVIAVSVFDFSKSNKRFHLMNIASNLLFHHEQRIDVRINHDLKQPRLAMRHPPENAIEKRPFFGITVTGDRARRS